MGKTEEVVDLELDPALEQEYYEEPPELKARLDTETASTIAQQAPRFFLHCGAPVQVVERLTAQEIPFRKELPLAPAFDTS